MAEITIVGAGIIGLAHAYVAARAGHKVTVYERNPAASGASIRNFGMIWPIGQAAGRMYQLALRSREIWLEMLREAGLPYLPTGSLHAAYREDEAAVGREFAEKGRALGYECEWLTAEETLKRSSALRRQGLLGALWSPAEMTVDPRLITGQMPAFLEKMYGVRFHFNTAVRTVDGQTVVAAGDDFQTLFPECFASAGLTRCKLQMLRTVPQPGGWQLGPALAFGLTFRHYPTFEICESLTALRQRVARETPEFDQWHIHVMVSQMATGELTLGDSHEYGLSVNIFDRAEINRLILDYAREHLNVPTLEIAELWHGVYAKHRDEPYLRMSPAPGVEVVDSDERNWDDVIVRAGGRNSAEDGGCRMRINAVIFDWAGTTVDFGSLAPVRTLERVFASLGVPITEAEARLDMGIPKRDHIAAILAQPRVHTEWTKRTGKPPEDSDVEMAYQEFLPLQFACLREYSALIPGVVDTAERLRKRGLKIGSTTGYTREMLDLLVEDSARAGYLPDVSLSPQDVGAGRPQPFMIWEAAVRLRAWPLQSIVKVGDTVSDIQEGLNAGVWSVGVARTGNMIGLNASDLAALSEAELQERLTAARAALKAAGAHYVIDGVSALDRVLDDLETRP